MQFEQTFFRTLEYAQTFDLVDGKLTITDLTNGNFLTFVRETPRHKCVPMFDVIE
jgi:heat shock protein HslJ